MRIVSTLPSATEIVFALGLGDQLEGITYECDFPPDVRAKRVVVRSRLSHGLPAAEIDHQVGEYLSRGESLYTIDLDALRAIEPDIVITQDLCHVCAASPDDLSAALAALPRAPRVISLTPRTLTDVWRDIVTVGEATGRANEARALAAELEIRVAAVREAVAGSENVPRVACLEWLDPPFNAGHWVPEMVSHAGGRDVLSRAGEPSCRIQWDEILATRPDVVLVMPCGYGLEQAACEFAVTPLPAGWKDLPAVRTDRVFAVNASSYFSRPGPRLADGVEILAQILHPERARAAVPKGSYLQLTGGSAGSLSQRAAVQRSQHA